MLEVLSLRGYATIQDQGRFGTKRYGIPMGGFMDIESAHHANQMIGNQPVLALIELFSGGMEFQCLKDHLIAIAGAKAKIKVANTTYTSPCSFNVNEGELVSIGQCVSGQIIYIALKGGIFTDLDYGSASTYLPTTLGGNRGKTIGVGDSFKTNESKKEDVIVDFPLKEIRYTKALTLRFKRGPEFDLITDQSKKSFQTESFLLKSTNRVGYRVSGPSIKATTNNLSSRFVTRGTVQLPPDGNPIILLSDSPTTGGYPRVAQVYEPDINMFCQMRVSSRIRFKEII
jgi:antagonist of KipI